MTDSQFFLTDKRERREMAVTRAAVATVTPFLCAEPVLPPAVCKALLPVAQCPGPGFVQLLKVTF